MSPRLDLAARTAPYRAVLGSRIRAQRTYRTSFRLDLASSFLVGLVELTEVWVLFHSVGRLGGLGVRAGRGILALPPQPGPPAIHS